MGWFAKLNIASKLSVMVASVIFVFSLLSGFIYGVLCQKLCVKI